MKRIISNLQIIFILLIFYGCGNEIPLTHIPSYFDLSALNLARYSAKNFLFTPYTYNYKYNSICIISITMMPEAELKTLSKMEIEEGINRLVKNNPNKADEIRNANYRKRAWSVKSINLSNVLDSLYQIGTTLGADAIVNLQIENLKDHYVSTIDDENYPVSIEGYKISGFAIKRISE